MDTVTLAAVEAATGVPRDRHLGACHALSLEVVRAGVCGEPGPRCRVVRGMRPGIGSQHSWIVVGDPYDPDATLYDVTAHAWGLADDVVISTVGAGYAAGYTMHGYDPSSIWEFGRPPPASGPALELDVADADDDARLFLDLLGPLDAAGWLALARYPHGGWPHRPIRRALCTQVPDAAVLLPIDVYSTLADANPDGLYW